MELNQKDVGRTNELAERSAKRFSTPRSHKKLSRVESIFVPGVFYSSRFSFSRPAAQRPGRPLCAAHPGVPQRRVSDRLRSSSVPAAHQQGNLTGPSKLTGAMTAGRFCTFSQNVSSLNTDEFSAEQDLPIQVNSQTCKLCV